MKKPKITNSNKLYNKAKKIIPGGSQTFSKGVTQFVEGFAPKYLHRGKGAHVWDVDKNKYLDYVMGCGSGQAEVRTMFANFLAMLAVVAHAAKTEMTLSMSRPLRLNADRRQYHSSSSNQHHPKFST